MGKLLSKAGPELPHTGEIWREAPSLNREVLSDLYEKIEKYTPDSNLNVNRVNILILGQVGAGKSSFINTINSIFTNRITQKCSIGSNRQTCQTMTTTFRKHDIKSSKTGRSLNITLCDVYGLTDEADVNNDDLTLLVEGNIKDKYKFKQSRPITPEDPSYIATPEFRDKIHCVVFVCDATTIAEYSGHCLTDFNKLMQHMCGEDVPKAVVLTKIDELSKCLDPDLSTVFQNRKAREAVELAATIFGVPRCYIHPVKNYEKETYLKEKISCLALMALDHIIGYADDFLRNNPPHNQNDVNETG